MDAELIYSNKGLDINYSADGMWGKGIYFAVKASYSCPHYCNKVKGMDQTYEVFLANVILGNSHLTPTSRDIREPPLIEGKKDEHYDSIKGNTNGSDVFIVYDNVKTYPGLLVCYKSSLY